MKYSSLTSDHVFFMSNYTFDLVDKNEIDKFIIKLEKL